MDRQAEASGVGELPGGGRQPAPSEVLHPSNEPPVECLEAGVDERLLHDRVAELNMAALGRRARGRELPGGERDAPDAVAAGQSADEHHPVPGAFGPVRPQAGLRKEPDASDVDEGAHGIGPVEPERTGDRRNADAVAVIPDPATT